MYYSSNSNFFSVHAVVYAQKSWKRSCPDFATAELNYTIIVCSEFWHKYPKKRSNKDKEI